MKDPTNPRGRIYNIKPRREWTLEAFQLDDITDLSFRKVLVVGKSATHKGCWRVAVITSRIDDAGLNDLYIPICPAKKNRKTERQLVLCHLDQLECGHAWVNLNEIFELPRCAFEDTRFELQVKSNNKLVHFMRARRID